MVTPNVFQPGRLGGGERYVSELSLAMSERGHEVSLLAIPKFGKAFSFDLHRGQVTAQLSLIDLMRLARQHDLIHVHQLKHVAFGVSLMLKAVSKCRIVLTDHGGSSRNIFRLLGPLRLKLIDGIAAVSEWSLRDIDKWNRVRNALAVYGGGDHILRNPIPPGKKKSRFDFVFVGRLLPHKGLHIAIASLPSSMSLAVIGEKRDEQYFQTLKELSIGKKVHFFGALSDAALGEVVSSSSSLLLPSVGSYRRKKFRRPELLGLVALESLFLGNCVIGSDLGGLGELLRLTGQLAVPPNSVQAWADSLSSLDQLQCSFPNLEKFTWSSVAKQVETVYLRSMT